METLKHRVGYEWFLVGAGFIVFIFALTKYNLLRFYGLGTDSAGFVALIHTIADNGTMVTPIFTSFYSAIPLLSAPPETYCTAPLDSLYQTSSFSQWHPYLIAYLLALPVKYFGISSVVISALINAINIAGSVVLIYWFLRRKGLTAWECLGFILAVSIARYWVGTIAGQYYFDRLFILPGLMLVLFCYEQCNRDGKAWLPICMVTVVSAILISERTALLTGLLTFGYWVLAVENRLKGKGLAMLFFSIVSLAYVVIYMKVFQNSAYYSGLGLVAMWHNVSIALTPGEPLFRLTLKWIGFVSPLVILAFMNWRYGLLTLAALVPNLLVSVGGAEKTGFLTHYHAGYIPFLVGFAAIGYATLINKVRARYAAGIGWRGKSETSALIVAVAISVIIMGASKASEARYTYLTIAAAARGAPAVAKKKIDMMAFLERIPKDASVSSPEWTMPTLAAIGVTQVDYMPIGLGNSRFVIAHYLPPATLPEIPSYLDTAAREKISACIQNKLAAHYYPVSEVISDGARYVIYEKRS